MCVHSRGCKDAHARPGTWHEPGTLPYMQQNTKAAKHYVQPPQHGQHRRLTTVHYCTASVCSAHVIMALMSDPSIWVIISQKPSTQQQLTRMSQTLCIRAQLCSFGCACLTQQATTACHNICTLPHGHKHDYHAPAAAAAATMSIITASPHPHIWTALLLDQQL